MIRLFWFLWLQYATSRGGIFSWHTSLFIEKLKMNNLKETKPIIAVCYDFDKTLSPDDMQAQGFIQSTGMNVQEFWRESNGLASERGMDQNLAYMYTMCQKARGKILLNRSTLNEYGSKINLFKGVKSWFKRINKYGEERGIIIEHYIISSGLKEMIEGTSIAKEFKMIYACSYLYDENGVPIWPAMDVNYTSKTQFLFRIEKGTLDVNDQAVNDYFEPDNMYVPFRNIIYIGDSDTDIPCMKLVNSKGGHSIGVYNPTQNEKGKVYKMMKDNRISHFVPADYSYGSELDQLVKTIIDKTVYNEKLESLHNLQNKETIEHYKQKTEDEQEKEKLITELENSNSFKRTHEVINKMTKHKWTKEESRRILDITENNSQIKYIEKDKDIEQFLSMIKYD